MIHVKIEFLRTIIWDCVILKLFIWLLSVQKVNSFLLLILLSLRIIIISRIHLRRLRFIIGFAITSGLCNVSPTSFIVTLFFFFTNSTFSPPKLLIVLFLDFRLNLLCYLFLNGLVRLCMINLLFASMDNLSAWSHGCYLRLILLVLIKIELLGLLRLLLLISLIESTEIKFKVCCLFRLLLRGWFDIDHGIMS